MRLYSSLRFFSAAIALTLAPFVAHATTPSYPNFVVDAQIPIPSSDGFSNPRGLAVAPGGTIYVADTGNNRVLKITPAGVQTTVSFGTLKPALGTPGGVALDSAGNLYVTDTATNRVIKLAPGATNGLAIITTTLAQPTSIAVDSSGNLAILNSANNTITERRGGGAAALFNTGSTTLVTPITLAFNNVGALYVGDQGKNNVSGGLYLFPKLGGTAANVTPPGVGITLGITGIASDAVGNEFITIGPVDSANYIVELPASGASALLIPTTTFYELSAIALDSIGNIYFADAYSEEADTHATVNKLYYNNAANFGPSLVGVSSPTILFNFGFFQDTTIQSAQALTGGVIDQEYATSGFTPYACYPGSGNVIAPSNVYGFTTPGVCSLSYHFTPTTVGGRPGALRLKTSAGNLEQLVTGTGLGAQIALMNAVVTPKLTQYYPQSLIADASNTYLYFSNGSATSSAVQGTYKVLTSSSTATMVSTRGGLLSVNGAGDLFIFDGTEITKIPSDGTAVSTIAVPASVQQTGGTEGLAFAMDYNGAFYIANSSNANAPFLTRVSATGVASAVPAACSISCPFYVRYLTSDLDGNLYETGYDISKLEVGTGSYQYTEYSGMNGGDSGGDNPTDLGVDESQTLYYYNFTDVTNGLDYLTDVLEPAPVPPGAFDGTGNTLPLYTNPGVYAPSNNGLYVPFIPTTGNQQIATTPNGKMYFINSIAKGDTSTPTGIFLVDRTQGAILSQAFQSGFQGFGGPTQYASVYNIGNEPLVFTNNTSAYTQTGTTSAFTLAAPSSYTACAAGTSVTPTDYCAIEVTDANPNGTPLAVDTLHFLTNAINNSTVSFKITGPPAP